MPSHWKRSTDKKSQCMVKRGEQMERSAKKKRKRSRLDRGHTGVGEKVRRGAEERGDIWWPEAICGDIFTPLLISNARTMCSGSFVTCFPNKLVTTLCRCICCPQCCVFVWPYVGELSVYLHLTLKMLSLWKKGEMPSDFFASCTLQHHLPTSLI